MTVVENPVAVMQRYELKYVLSSAQEAFLRKQLEGRMRVDRFGLTTIASLYYDTPDFRLINASLESAPFKEKLRLRAYGAADNASPVFLELKRKAEGVVYKRRVQTTIPQADRFLSGRNDLETDGQIDREIKYFRDFYGNLAPSCMIIYDRTAYFEPGGDLRLTIDNHPRFRTDRLDLRDSMDGEELLTDDQSILEVKVQGAMPLWLSSILDKGKIYKNKFSKYGEAYKRQIRNREVIHYV